jgi:uncharacterized protein (TIGR03086 family)
VAAWGDDALMTTEFDLPWGRFPGAGAVAGYTLEMTTHGWDLADAIGYRGPLDDRLAEAALAIAQRILPPERRGEGVPFEAPVPVAGDADPYVQLAGWLGRRPVLAA